jgi:hypothetical protein
MHRCLQDIVFGYCKSTPDYAEQPTIKTIMDRDGNPVGTRSVGGTCKLDKSSCGNYSNHMDVKVVDNPNLVFKLNGTEGESKKKKVKKIKPVQESFF